MMRNEIGDGIKAMYKEDSSLPGWLPWSVLPHFRSAAWYRHFRRTTYRPHEVLECSITNCSKVLVSLGDGQSGYTKSDLLTNRLIGTISLFIHYPFLNLLRIS